jgi:peptide/nickel transport system substrate-binding protein
MTNRRVFLTNAIRLAGGIALAACAPSATAPASASAAPSGAAKRGGQLVYADITDPTSLDPAFITDRTGARTIQMIYDPLIDLDSDATLKPALAESWDLSSDAKAVTLRLRKGVKFHDGTAFDAEAVKVHFERHLDPKTKSLRTGELLGIAGLDVVDGATVRIRLKDPNPQFLYLLIDWNAFIESPTAVQRYGADYGLHPVGTGPFKFAEYVKSDHVTVERNPDYWDKGKPYLDGVKFRSIPTDATRLVELRTGGVHVMQEAPLQDVERMQQMSDIKLSHRTGGRYSYWYWNTETSPYGKSKEFRQALNWTVDRDGIQKAVLFNTGRLNYAPFHAGTPFDDPSYKPFTRDLAKAKALIERSGVPLPAKFHIHVGPTAPYPKLVQVIAANYADVGVTVEIQSLADTAITAETDKGNFHLSVNRGGWSWRPDPSLYLRTIYHSTSTYRKFIYKDPELDDLIAQGEREAATDKRKVIYRQLADRINDDAWTILAYQEETFVALSPKVGGWVQRADGKHHFQDMWLE